MKKKLKYIGLILLLFLGIFILLYSCHTYEALEGVFYE